MGDYPGPRPGPCTITLVRERQEGQRRGVAMGAEARVTQCGFEDRRGLRAKEYRQPLEAGEGKRQILPPSLRKEHSPADTLTSASETSHVQSCSRVSSCCFTPLSAWQLMAAGTGTDVGLHTVDDSPWPSSFLLFPLTGAPLSEALTLLVWRGLCFSGIQMNATVPRAGLRKQA